MFLERCCACYSTDVKDVGTYLTTCFTYVFKIEFEHSIPEKRKITFIKIHDRLKTLYYKP